MCLSTKAGSRPTDNFILRNIPSSCIKIAGHLGMKGADQIKRVYKTGGVSPTLTTMQGGWQEPKIIQRIIPEPVVIDDYNHTIKNDGITPSLTSKCGAISKGNGIKIMEPVIAASRGRNVENPSSRIAGEEVAQRFEININGTSNTLTSVQKDNYVLVPSLNEVAYASHGDSINFKNLKSKTRRGTVGKQISQTLDTSCNIGVLFLFDVWWWVRKLTPRECLRLQDFPDTFNIVVSNSQAYRQAGNSMSVNILEMIFTCIEKAKRGEATGSLFDFMEMEAV